MNVFMFIDYDKAFDSSVNSSSTDFVSRTGDRRCVHRTPEGDLHQQLDDSPPTQRKRQYQHQERFTTGRYHIAQAVHAALESILKL